jgi:methylmalonyl-CoA mutase
MDQKNRDEKLFPEFPPSSTVEWEDKIKADLKGADYDRKLVWKTDEGFDVRPYYREENLEQLGYLESLPGEFPFVRGGKTDRNSWIIRQDIYPEEIAEANRQALEAIRNGANAIGLCVKSITTHKQMNELLNGIDLHSAGIHFYSSRSYPLTLELFLYELNHRDITGENVRGSLNFDPFGYLLLKGDFYVSRNSNMEEAEYLLTTVQKRLPEFKVITVNGHYFQDAGSTLVQELAFSLASANEYLGLLTDKGFSVDAVARRIMLSLATGPDYFLEIAKLRAARLLWAKILREYHPEDPKSSSIYIHSSTAEWNKTIYDPYVNMLRTTTEGMAAAIGNADSVSLLPFDMPFKSPDEFSMRIARNQQLIFREEAHLDKTIDPSAGSYYIENLTHSIAFYAWKLFKEIEEKGGFSECIKAGFIQDEIEKNLRKREANFAQRKIVRIGTNQYPNPLESMADKLQPEKVTVGEDAPSTYRKLKLNRDSLTFEKLRLATERFVMDGHRKPSVFLVPVGNVAMRRARAGFSTNFFGCAGYEIIDNNGFDSAAEGARAALATPSEIVVICSSDEEYPLLVPEICSAIKARNPGTFVIVAGYPKDLVESLKAAGVDDFIHVRSNLFETLQQYHQKLGISIE